MFAIAGRIKADAPDLSDLLFGFGVVMPMERFATKSEEIDLAVLLDKRDFDKNLSLYIERLERRWRIIYKEKGLREPRRPSVSELKRIRKILRPDVESAFSLGSWLSGIEQELLELTNEQIRIARRLAANPRMVVRGKAGTGKTVLAVNRALQLAEQGLTVLYLCFNQLLAKHVAESIKELPGAQRITVRHLHGHYTDAIRAAGFQERLASANGEERHVFGVVFPQLYLEALMETEPQPFGAVVIDEAQDVLTVEHLEALDLTVAGGLEAGQWHLFLDPQQNIYGKLSEDAERRLDHISIARDELLDNCRNTREVAYQTSILSGLDVAVEGAPSGPACECIFYGSPAEGLAMIDAELQRLLKADVKPSNIIILSTRRRENSLIAAVPTLAGLRISDVGEGLIPKSITFSTMHAFKGLERSVVLAIDLGDIGQEEWSMLHYAGLSRAKTLLVPFVPRASERNYRALAAAFGRRISR
jgi:hypothetical protein